MRDYLKCKCVCAGPGLCGVDCRQCRKPGDKTRFARRVRRKVREAIRSGKLAG